MTYYYALLDDNDVCFMVSTSETQIENDVYIQIDSNDTSLIGKHYNRETQQFETATFKHLAECSTDEINVGETDECLTDALNGKFAKTAVNNPITAIADDTVTKWIELGTGIFYFNRSGVLNDQPSQYGFLINFVSGANVFQLWKTQPNAGFCNRGGNANGWSGTWKVLVTSADLANYMPKTGGDFSGAVNFNGGLVRVGGQQALFNSNTMMSVGTGNLPLNLVGKDAIYSQHSIQVTSDLRLKENFKPVNPQQAVNFIQNLNVTEFNYKGSTDKKVGLIAQQVQLADPEFSERFVKTNPADGMLSVNYTDLINPLIVTVQALMNEVVTLREMVQQAK